MPEIRGYRCDDCGDIFETPAFPKLVVSSNPEFRGEKPLTFCSYDCLASWAIAQNDKRRADVNGPCLPLTEATRSALVNWPTPT